MLNFVLGVFKVDRCRFEVLVTLDTFSKTSVVFIYNF